MFSADASALAEGDHTLNVRAKGTDGIWRLISNRIFAVTTSVPGINMLSKVGGGGWAIITAAILGAAICASIKEVKRRRKAALAAERSAQ